ncbi:TetR/AcrR family transcriptional regulator [Kineosporia babensis]|uniref:TetR family transcriptional regulator n=1 Tax=Kineosporia babensis TaxID=499548 RepID=A0A9X1NPT5_9ACTN|nr:TetR family transcriptional regulator [Kineosporia babensis]MCD5317061.1 TetR family transcriptional regulator [Kineosporia babensis]
MDRRELIIDAALQVATTEGFGALSVRSVAAAAGIGPTTLRHYFPTQALLYEALSSRFVMRALSDLDIADQTRPPVERLHECLIQFLPGTQDVRLELFGWFEVHRHAVGPDANEGARVLLQAARRQSGETVRRWLDLLVEEGHTLTRDPDVIIQDFLALLAGLHMTMLIEIEQNRLPAAIETLRWFSRQTIKSST